MSESQREKTDMANIHVLLIGIFGIVFLCDYYFTCNSIVVRVKDPRFSLRGPYNTTEYVNKDVYEHLIDLKQFSFKINPQPCEEYPEGLLLLIIVASNPRNYENRMVIRSTWGKSVAATKMVFLFGESDNATIARQIRQESDDFGDIVQGSFIDAYRNMTYKHVMGLKWIAHHCPMAKYVLKTDDDIVLNSREMRRFLSKELSPWGAWGLIACQTLEHALAQRSDNSKWKVTTAEYGSSYYPTYCAGWAILYSQDVVPKLLDAAQNTPYFWIDDVHITGVIAQRLGIGRTTLTSLILTPRRVNVLRTLGSKYVGPFLLGPPDLNVHLMRQIWKSIPA